MKITKSKRVDIYSDVNYTKCGWMCKITGKLKTVILLIRLTDFFKNRVFRDYYFSINTYIRSIVKKFLEC